MAYVDRSRTRETAASGVAATMLVGGIGFVLVAGLAMNVVRNHDRPVVIHNWTLPAPPPPTPQVDRPPTTHVAPVSAPVAERRIVPAISRVPTITLPPIGTSEAGTGTAATIAPPPPPPTADRSSGAVPRGNPGDWVTTDDYPASALRDGQQGTTDVRVDIGLDGRATACTITTSSGSDALDRTACRMLMRRARFTAAHDASGAPVAASYTSRIVWRVPAD